MNLKVSVIIPNRENESVKHTIEKILESDYDKRYLEIFQITGNHPAVQRNICIKEAKGDIIYFIDNDSEIDINNIKKAVEIFNSDENIGIVGGPALHKVSTKKEEDIDLCLSSFLAVGPLSERYTVRTSKPHFGNDRKVILCNLFIRKSALDEVNYFNESLYPNEENELIERIIAKDYKLIYHPEIIIYRPPRKNVKEYIRMLVNYGRGRCEQMRIRFTLKNIVFIIPALFSIYIITYIPLLIFLLYANKELAFIYGSFIYLYLILTYIAASITVFKRKKNKLRSFTIMPFMFFFTHFFYGGGFIYGFVRPYIKKNKIIKASINKVKSFE